MMRRHPRMCLFGVRMTTHNTKGFKTPKKGAWLGIFQPKWQNYKMVTSPAGNIGSIPNFDVVIEPHSWLRGLSRITTWRTAAILQNIGNAITRLPGYQWTNLDETWVVASHHVPNMSAMLRLPWQWPLTARHIVHSAVMGVWSPNAWTNFDEIWYTTAN